MSLGLEGDGPIVVRAIIDFLEATKQQRLTVGISPFHGSGCSAEQREVI